MNKEIKFYFEKNFFSVIYIPGADHEVQIWAGPHDDEQMETCLSLSKEEAIKMLADAIGLLSEDLP